MRQKLDEKTELYSDAQVEEIKRQWEKDKLEIDANPAFGYYIDRDAEYQRHLANKNLQSLFRHASHLYWMYQLGEKIHLYPNEAKLIVQIYKGILNNGFYSKSKTEEKRKRAWLGKISSRQSYQRYKKER